MTTTENSKSRRERFRMLISCFYGMMALFAGLLTMMPAASENLPAYLANPPAAHANTAPGALQQFTAGRHLLGFQADGMVTVGSHYLLKVDFIDAKTVTPVSSGDPESNEVSRRTGFASAAFRRTGFAAPSGTFALGAGAGKQNALETGGDKAPPLNKIMYKNLWPGISLAYENTGAGIVKSTYYLQPGANAENIRLRYNAPVAMDANGGLRFTLPAGQMRESAPVAWQEIGGLRRPVQTAWRMRGERQAGFSVGDYNPDYPLIIDPVLSLDWNTFLGSSNSDYGYSIAVDAGGNVYVTGKSFATWGSPVNAYTGGSDAFAAKLDNSGALQWHTFLGSAVNDYGYGIAADASGNVYVIGESWSSWGSPVTGYGGGAADAFIVKLNNSGVLQWLTFTGSSSIDVGYGIALNGGNIYISGTSNGSWGSPVNAYAGGVGTDAFAAKLNDSGVFQWHTFMGGSSGSTENGKDIAVDADGNLYVAGSSGAWGSPVNAHAGGYDAFAAKLDNSGALLWHTFMGSAGSDSGNGVTVDTDGNVYAAGKSDSSWGSPVNAYEGGDDAFTAKLDNSGTLQWNTFMGSSGSDDGNDITMDTAGNVYVSGQSNAGWGSPVNAHAGGDDAFAAKLDIDNGALQANTFMGSSSNDYGMSMSADASGDIIYVAGYSDAAWGSPVNAHASGNDLFIARLPTCIPNPVVANSNDSGAGSLRLAIADACAGDTIAFDAGIAGQTITLNSQLSIKKDLTIDGTGQNITVSGGNSRRVFEITAGNVTLTEFSIVNGNTINSVGDNGGGINHAGSGTLTLSNVTVDNNTAAADGGGLYNIVSGTVNINDSVFSNNAATANGGGIKNDDVLTLSGVTVNNNSSGGGGAGIYSSGSGSINITDSRILFNTGGNGIFQGANSVMTVTGSVINNNVSGIESWGDLTVSNTTIALNTADGIIKRNNAKTGTLNNVTIANNLRGIFKDGASASLTVTNTIAATNGADCAGDVASITSDGYNLANDATCTIFVNTGDTTGTDPLLGALQDNGGRTETMLPGAPAINVGNNAACETADQRGVPRPLGTACDIGAVKTLPACPSANIAYVDSTAAGTKEGDSWTNAFTELRSALGSLYLSKCSSITEIHVAQGTYTPGTARSDTFLLKSGVAVYGGYPNGGGVRNSDPATNGTVLSGEIGAAGIADNSYHVVHADNSADNTALLDGFTISGGYAEGDSGGGILSQAGSPTLTNLIIRNNQTDRFGGGVRITNFGSPTLTNILIENNSADISGGGLSSRESTPTLRNVIVRGNSAGLNGGGISNSASGNMSLSNALISGNQAFSNGGGFNNKFSSASLSNVTITGNHALIRGGGIRSNSTSTGLVLNNMIIWGNTAGTAGSESFIEDDTGTHSAGYSLIQGSGGSGTGWWAANNFTDSGNNIDTAPLFVTAVPATPGIGGDLHLSGGSAAMNMGTNTGCPGTDPDGTTRPQGDFCDMGAYEFVNTAPVLDDAQAPALSAINEDNVSSAGDSVADIVVNGSITDPDGAVEAIAVTDADNSNGVWQFSLNNGTSWSGFGTPADSAARLLDGTLTGGSTHKIRFAPNADWNGAAALTFRAWDRFSGTAGAMADASVNDGTTAFSALNDTIGITVAPVNDPPSFTASNPPSAAENAGAQSIAGWASFSPGGGSDEAGQTVFAYTVSNITNPALFAAGPAVDASGNLSYTPAAGTGASSFDVSVQDNGGIANGGTDTSATQTFTITLGAAAAGNEAPVITEGDFITVSMDEDAVPAPFNLTLHATDANSASIFWSVSSPPAHGAADAGGTGNSKAVSYTPDANYNGTDNFSIRVRDAAGAYDTISVDVIINSVPDCPPANVLYVRQNAAGANTGQSWTDAHTDLQAALSQFASGECPAVDQIWVAAGTYKPAADTDRNATFQLRSGLALHGGFSGDETDLSQHSELSNESVLSGDIGAPGDDSDNSYHVVSAGGTDNTAVLHGFIITGGRADQGASCPHACGGGFYNGNGSPVHEDNTFRNNFAHSGGGMYISAGGNPEIRNTIFDANTAVEGGGLLNAGGAPALNAVFFKNNSADNGGGMLNRNGGDAILLRVNFNNNTATSNGGGILNDNSSPLISHSFFSANTAADGAGMANLSNSAPRLSHVILDRNTAAVSGGGMLNNTGSPDVRHATFSGNSAPDGSAMANLSAAPAIANSIFWHHSGTGALISDDAGSNTSINASIVQGGWNGAGGNNSAADPLFADGMNDLHVLKNSPAVDAGDDALIPADFTDAECMSGDGNAAEAVEVDFDCSPRLADGDGDGTARVDMGAYELSAVPVVRYPLTVTKTGAGSGSVDSALPGIQCGADCTQNYAAGSLIVLIVSADPGSVFAGWNAACGKAEEQAVSVAVIGAVTCEARFEPLFALTAAKTGNGIVNSEPAGITCGAACSVSYADGTAVTLTAVPDAGWEFDAWQGDCTGGLVLMDAEKSCTAVFTSLPGPTSALSAAAIAALDPQQLAAIDAELFLQQPDEEIIRFFTNLNPALIAPADIVRLLPLAWEIDLSSGEFTVPPDTLLGLKFFSPSLPAEVSLPENLPDLNSSLSLGGEIVGETFQSGMNRTLSAVDLSMFTLSQQPNGILLVKGSGIYEGIAFSFLPDTQNIVQVGEEIPVGLSVNEGGWYVMTTPDSRQFTMIPAPHDPACLLVQIEAGGKVELGAAGDVLLSYPQQTRQASFVYMAVIFDPFIEPAPAGICTEISFGNIQCDWNSIPPYRQPGIHAFSPFLRAARSGEQTSLAVCEDGTAQIISPTVPEPRRFMEALPAFAGVEKAVFNVDGTFSMRFEGRDHRLLPDFDVQTGTLAGDGSPRIVFHADGAALEYSLGHNGVLHTSRLRISPPLQLTVLPDNFVINVTKIMDIPLEILALLRPQHLTTLDAALFAQQPSEDISRFFTNLDPAKIAPADIERLMPPAWELALDTGALTAPTAALLGIKEILRPAELSLSIVLPPRLPDMNSEFGLGGEAGAAVFREEIDLIFVAENFSEFTLSQQPNSILRITGSDAYAGVEFAFMPDTLNIVRAGEEIPVGLSINEGGWPVLTLPGGMQFTMVPAPHDPACVLAGIGEGGAAELGAKGDMLLTWAKQTQLRQ
ncbi:MAG: hypothetical protein GY862_37200, partial [Gammaproteobacteria bacterium]|nr:hypothetical protein [Gammaproteobacteria bacterium]